MRDWALSILVVLLVHTVPANAVEPSVPARTGTRLTLGDAIQRAGETGPGMRAARAGQTSAAVTRKAAASPVSLPPRLEIEVARHSYPGGVGTDVTASLWQDLSLGGLGTAKRSFAASNTQVRAIELELARRQAVHHATIAWVDARHARSLSALREKSLSLAEQMVRVTASRVQAGAVPPVELVLATSVLGSTRASLLDAHGRVVEADARLRHAVGLDPNTPLEIDADLTQSDAPAKEAPADLTRTIKGHPLVRLAEMGARQADARAELEAARGRPVLGVGLSYAREATGDRLFGAMVSLPLPIVNPAALEASMARAEADIARARSQEVETALVREALVAWHETGHARELREALKSGSLEPGQSALGEILKRYERGDVGLAETLAARRELVSVEEAYLAACADVFRADARFAYVAGPRRSAVTQ